MWFCKGLMYASKIYLLKNESCSIDYIGPGAKRKKKKNFRNN